MSLFDSGSKGLKFPVIGTSHTGTVTAEPFERQQTEYGTNNPAVWPSGEPKMQIIVNLQTQERDDPDDDGERTLYVASNALKHAIGKAIRDAGAKDLEVGGTLTVTYSGNDPQSKNPQNPKKLYTAVYQKPDGVFAQQPAAQPAPQPGYQPQQQPAAQPQPVAQQLPLSLQQPAAQPVAQPAAQQVTQPAAQPATAPVTPGIDPTTEQKALQLLQFGTPLDTIVRSTGILPDTVRAVAQTHGLQVA